MVGSTSFHGEFTLTPLLNAAQVEYLAYYAKVDSYTNFEKRDHLLDPRDFPSDIPDDSVDDINCGWHASSDGTRLLWDYRESTCYEVDWLRYLIHKLFIPWGIEVTGNVFYQDEEMCYDGRISVKNNVITCYMVYDNEPDYDSRCPYVVYRCGLDGIVYRGHEVNQVG